jgi:hypothetical protein
MKGAWVELICVERRAKEPSDCECAEESGPCCVGKRQPSIVQRGLAW